MIIEIEISDSKKRVLESVLGIGEITGWLQHAIDNKCRKRVDSYVEEFTNLNPKKMTEKDKLVELDKVELPVRED